jgi:hypothetical protein
MIRTYTERERERQRDSERERQHKNIPEFKNDGEYENGDGGTISNVCERAETALSCGEAPTS